MRVLVTGGAGYIGSHTVLRLLEEGHVVHVVDNLSNSSLTSLERVRGLVGEDAGLTAQKGDIRTPSDLDEAFGAFSPDAVIHFAGLKAVGESVEKPLMYFDNNVAGSIELLQAMERHGCRTLVFSSSATVYGDRATPPFREDSPQGTTNPYGATKLMVEQILDNTAAGPGGWSFAALRYFNPIGAHESGRIGEDPLGIPNNLVPYVAQVAAGRREHVNVFGDDYDTPDGTGVRDYLHVMDLAEGHLRALGVIHGSPGFKVWNLGTGRGSSVLEVVQAFRDASGQEIPAVIGPRRPGDIATSYADASRARDELGWVAERDLATMCRDHWAWQSANPDGYRG
ncbi:UDP-glucose 4-epimerase GalE [Mariniluteicoccus endophyticus]